MADAGHARKAGQDGPFGRFSEFVDRHRVAVFYTLLLALSWSYLFLTMDGGEALSRMAPLVLVGPSVCAFLVVLTAHGTAGARALASGILRVGAPARVHLIALVGVPSCFLVAAYAVAFLAFPGQAAAPSTASLVNAAVNFAAVFVLAGLGEEFGWRGLALPRLQERHGPLAASSLVGLMWSAWHLPLGFGEQGWASGNMVFFVSVTAAAFFYTWLFNRTGGSLLAVALLHTTENASGWIYQDAFSFEPPGFLFFDALKAGVWVLLAGLAVVFTRGTLAHRRSPQP
ncbi:CPBP family intramembrane glutamic endopeptidase [Nocardiopsis xinjiangensis]|uniref:CPBP family intramembrane glutamic endopeptidase n=1 Tax=Nocardiopsis xinjiangensis TaxID=124285 RepID=UPI00034A0209|nr:type II CAAX endopeptidase family protein [Nocardiopsis xinjiangensis]